MPSLPKYLYAALASRHRETANNSCFIKTKSIPDFPLSNTEKQCLGLN